MAYSLTSITGSDTVGQAFIKVNANLNKQIVSGFTSGNTLRLVSKDGTQEIISLSAITATGGNFLPLSGGTISGNTIVTNGNYFKVEDGTDTNSIQINVDSIDLKYDYDNVRTRIKYSPITYSNVDININDAQGDGYIVVAPNPSGQEGKFIRVTSNGQTWEYFDLSTEYLSITGGTYISGITSAGTGQYLILSDIIDKNIVYKTISAGTNISITENNNTLTFNSSASGGGSGTITGATNNGGGIDVYQSATTSTLAFRTLSAGTNVTITTGSTGLITISSTGGGISGTYVSGLTNISGGISPISSITNNNLIQKAFTAGTNVTLTESNGLITIAATAGSSTGLTTASTVGGGVSLISAITSNNLQLNSISGTAGMVVNAASNGLITFRGPNTANRVFVTDASGNMVNSGSLQTDNTNGTLGIGVAASTTSRLLLPTQTSTISPLRFTTSSTAISSPTNGDVWYLTAGDRLQFRKNAVTTDFIFKDNNITLTSTTGQRVVEVSSGGTLSATRLFQSFGVFNSVTTTTITNTTSETSIIPTGASIIGSATLQASTSLTPNLVTGKKYRFTANGTINTRNSSPGTLTARMKLGSAVIASVSGFSLHADLKPPTNNFFIDSVFTIRTASSGGTVVGFGSLQTDNSNLVQSGPNIACLANLGQITVDCTTDKIFDFTFQFSLADASNTITINEATLEYLN